VIRVPADETDARRHLAAEDEIAPGVAFTKHDYLPMLSGSPWRLRGPRSSMREERDVQTPMTSRGTELPSAPQGEDGAGRKPGRRAIVLLTAALGMLIVAGGIIALTLGDDARLVPDHRGRWPGS
jgi:hypothetical protein